jgi:hypothetical protein
VEAVDLTNQRSKPEGLTTVAAANHHNAQFVADQNELMNGLDSFLKIRDTLIAGSRGGSQNNCRLAACLQTSRLLRIAFVGMKPL